MTGTCKTCKWWDEHPGRYDDHRDCKHPKVSEEHGTEANSASDSLVYPYSEGAFITTGPDFGCIHHEEKP